MTADLKTQIHDFAAEFAVELTPVDVEAIVKGAADGQLMAFTTSSTRRSPKWVHAATAGVLMLLLIGSAALLFSRAGDSAPAADDDSPDSRGVSFNHFVGIQQSLKSQADETGFTATVIGADGEPLYWKLIALEEFDGTFWMPRQSSSNRPPETGRWEIEDQAFMGPTIEVISIITIDRLTETYIPAPYSPVTLSISSEVLDESYRVRADGALKLGIRAFAGLEYQVTSLVPRPNVGVLASIEGEFSRIFAQAARDGGIPYLPEEPPERQHAFADRSKLVDTSRLADEDERLLGEFASVYTGAAETDFERAILLEDFFLSSGDFTYDINVVNGHSSGEMVAWMLDPASPNYRTGYAEQFAASMAVLARTLGIPSRVILGFAPGEVTADGTVTVSTSDAHAWVELWFDSQGWVRFDPTPRPQGDTRPMSELLGFDPSEIVLNE